MNKRMKNMVQEIRSGRQLEENLPQLFSYMADQYRTYGAVRLAMHYYAFYEAYAEERTESGTYSISFASSMTVKINEIIRKGVLSGCTGEEREKAVAEIDSLRNDIFKRMNILTVYADIFQIYEYVLNRLEYRFGEGWEPIDEEEFAREILQYIFAEEDNLVINENIREIVGQLPVRITRQKYFDLLEDSLKAYLGAEASSLQTFLYMLRTSAMLYHEEGMEELYPELAGQREQMAAFDYKNITKEAYDQASDLLQTATRRIGEEADIYFGLQEIVNEVYVMLLCTAYAGMGDSAHEGAAATAADIIREINICFGQPELPNLPVGLLDRFLELEGVQEDLSYELTYLEDIPYEAGHSRKALVQGMMLEQLLQVLLRSQRLLSNSLFAELDEVSGEDIVDEELLERETKALLQEMSELLAGQDRMVSRAVMANTMNKLPVFFQDHKEVMEYVRYSIERCSDQYEKAACHEIIHGLFAVSEIMSE